MRAEVGDRIVVHGVHVGDNERQGVVKEVRGRDGAPPYLVDWADGHQGLYYPAGDAVLDHPGGR